MWMPFDTTLDEAGLRVAPLETLEGLLLLLRRLDGRLLRAISSLSEASEADADPDVYQGLVTSLNEALRLLAQEPGVPLNVAGEKDDDDPVRRGTGEYPSCLRTLAERYGLSDFDLEIVVVALAPELDLRYEKIYAYIQDDITRRRPSVDLALNLLCSSAIEKLRRREHFASDAPLIRNQLLQLVPDANQHQPPLLAQYLKLEDQVVNSLLGHKSLDRRLLSFCRLLVPSASGKASTVAPEVQRALHLLAGHTSKTRQSFRLYFSGECRLSKRRVAETLACELDARLLCVDLTQAQAASTEFEQIVKLVLLEAQLQDAVLFIEESESARVDAQADAHAHLVASLKDAQGIVILSGARAPVTGDGGDDFNPLEINFPMPNFEQRKTGWSSSLRQRGVALAAEHVDALAGRYRLAHGAIEGAVARAFEDARWRMLLSTPTGSSKAFEVVPTVDDFFTSARAQSSRSLAALARYIEAGYDWQDIVLPPDQLSQLTDMCAQAKQRHVVYDRWGFERKLSAGKGLNALFSGASGTGKTMAAEVISRELQLGLYKIDLSQVVSKYVGETEKNLERTFRDARASNSILFFDEADALFGKRTEVRDAHDRYANIEVGYLLQKMEEHEGIAILATNLRHHLDDAFVRRMNFIVEFPFPDEDYRRRIWDVMFPPEAPLDDDIDFRVLARDIKLAGGNIKNIALAAAFSAASDGGRIRMSHLMQAARREHQKLGRTWSETRSST